LLFEIKTKTKTAQYMAPRSRFYDMPSDAASASGPVEATAGGSGGDGGAGGAVNSVTKVCVQCRVDESLQVVHTDPADGNTYCTACWEQYYGKGTAPTPLETGAGLETSDGSSSGGSSNLSEAGRMKERYGEQLGMVLSIVGDQAGDETVLLTTLAEFKGDVEQTINWLMEHPGRTPRDKVPAPTTAAPDKPSKADPKVTSFLADAGLSKYLEFFVENEIVSGCIFYSRFFKKGRLLYLRLRLLLFCSFSS